ncbi:MAG: adenylate kinase, partial [Candidatus Bathyarchaeota archaeon]|nr:adenylate kinase [Candidatus Bathyarchaeota archaeon]
TLAKKLSEKLCLDFIELDALHWEPNWVEAPDAIFRKRVETAISSERWVVAGNYKIVRDLIWSRADALIWLDYPLETIFWWLTRRTFKRWWSQELLWGTNRENILVHFKLWSQDSLYHWLFKTYWQRKREYKQLLSEPRNAHLTVVHFKSPHEAEKWFTHL